MIQHKGMNSMLWNGVAMGGRLVFGICALALAGCAGTPMNKGSHCVVEPGSMAGLHTVSWQTAPPVDLDDRTGYVSPVIVKGLENAVIAELGKKGFTFLTTVPEGEKADLRVAMTFRTRREVVSMSSTTSPCESTDCWERVDLGSAERMEIRTIGFLAADVYYQDEPVWRGWVERTLYPDDRDHADKVLGTAIPALFESFPP